MLTSGKKLGYKVEITQPSSVEKQLHISLPLHKVKNLIQVTSKGSDVFWISEYFPTIDMWGLI